MKICPNLMHQSIAQLWLAASATMSLALTACGGSDTPAPPPPPATTAVTTKVVDGAIQGAVVCLDENGNGQCDASEPQGITDASGNVTFQVPNADVGKYPILAVIGTNAVDAVNGPVKVPYTLAAPANQTAVITALTTLVQQTMATSGSSSAAAQTTVQNLTGIAVTLFGDYTQASAPVPPVGSTNPSQVARLLVLFAQQQAAALAGAVGTTAIDGTTITQANVNTAVQQAIQQQLPAIVSALSSPAVQSATTAAALESALEAAAAPLVANSGVSTATAATVVAINNQLANTTAATATPAASVTLNILTYTDANNYFMHTFTGTVADNTPDANNLIRAVDRRQRSTAGKLTTWGPAGSSGPSSGAYVHWNGSAWVQCPINTANPSSVRTAQGFGTYNTCDGYDVGTSLRATFDVSGKLMSDVYKQLTAAGYTNLSLADPNVLGTAVFPTGSTLFYLSNTSITEAIAYYPGGVDSPAGTSNLVNQYSVAVSGGGVAASQPAGTACNSTEANTSGVNATTLESFIASKTGTPCVYGQGSITYNGTTYQSDVANEWWGNSTVSMAAAVGSVPLTPTSSSTGYYTGNTLLRAAFTGPGTSAVTYYACKQRYVSGSPRNCTSIGTGVYSISTLADGRVLKFSNLPPQFAGLGSTRVFVERGGVIYYGFQNKPSATMRARLNTAASNALLGVLGIPAIDPTVPLALTKGSYQGTWDVRDASTAVSATNGFTVAINADGSISCTDKGSGTVSACTLTFTDLSTGAFTLTGGAITASGNLDFLSGIGTGTYSNPGGTPASGSFVAGRR